MLHYHEELSGEKDPVIAGVICLSYPLHPPGKTDEIRHLQPGVPVLFVNGKRDALCTVKLMEKEINNLQCPYHLHWIEGGDHGVKVKGRKQSDILQELCTTVFNWCHTTLTGDDDKPPVCKKAKTVKDYFRK